MPLTSYAPGMHLLILIKWLHHFSVVVRCCYAIVVIVTWATVAILSSSFACATNFLVEIPSLSPSAEYKLKCVSGSGARSTTGFPALRCGDQRPRSAVGSRTRPARLARAQPRTCEKILAIFYILNSTLLLSSIVIPPPPPPHPPQSLPSTNTLCIS